MAIMHRAKAPDFSAISNSLLSGSGLSFGCRGFLAYLLTKPKDWECRMHDIEREGNIGPSARRTLMIEAEKAGYLTFARTRNPKGHFQSCYTVHENPVELTSRTQSWNNPHAEEPEADDPPPDNPGVGEPQADDMGDIVNTELPNTELVIPEKEQRVAAPPQPAAPLAKKARCGRCKASVPILPSNAGAVAWCITCNVDALAVIEPDIDSDAAKCIGFFKYEFERRFGRLPHVNKGKDFGIVKGLVTDYGKEGLQTLLRDYLASDDDKVKEAGYSIAFFTTRINPLLIKSRKNSGCELCRNDPNRKRFNLSDGMIFDASKQTARRCVCNQGQANEKQRPEQAALGSQPRI